MIGPKEQHKKQPATMPRGERGRLYSRTKGQCEWCGAFMRYDDMDAHHRLARGVPGSTWALSNIMAVHRTCHTVAAHSIHQQPKKAKELGFILSRNTVPSRTSACWVTIQGQVYQLTDDGKRVPKELPF